jgi:hypothetical protein
VPFATAWIATTRLASAPVALYTALFACGRRLRRRIGRGAFVAPRVAFAFACGAPILHVRPEAVGSRR